MHSVIRHFTLILSLLWITSTQADALSNTAATHGFHTPTENLVTGGQPSREELAALKEAGVTKIINLRGPDEVVPFDSKTEAETLGMEYVSLPISGAADITAENARALHQSLQEKDDTVFLHCASGNRVGALLAIATHQIDGKPVHDALALGRSAGLGSLEDKVRSVLENSSSDR